MAEGQQVGRVFVRVSPDTDNFRRDLRKQLERETSGLSVDVAVNADTGQAAAEIALLKKQLASLRSRALRIDIDGSAKQALDDMVGSASRLRGELDGASSSMSGFQGESSRGTEGLKRFNDEGRRGRGLGRRILSGFGGLFSGVGQIVKGIGQLFGSLWSGLNGGFDAFSKSASGAFSTMSSGLSSAAAGLGSIAVTVAIVLPIVLVLIGAVTALFGALSAGFGGLPVLISGLAIPILTIMTGLDGIKKAAEPLTAEFEKIKQTVSATFTRELTPVFERLRAVMPVLSAGFDGVAGALSGVAGALTDVITSEAGLRAIESAFKGVNTMLGEMTPGLESLLDGFLAVVGTEDLWRILGGTIGDILGGIGDFFKEIAEDGTLTAALEAVRYIIDDLMTLFFSLAKAAMEFFTAAAPGLSGFINGLRQFFENIDWAKLGGSFGDLFSAFGDFFANIDQRTIDGFTDSIILIADSVITFIETGALELMVKFFGMFVATLAGLSTVIPAVLDGIKELVEWIGKLTGGGNPALDANQLFQPDKFVRQMQDLQAEIEPQVNAIGQGIADSFGSPWAYVPEGIGQAVTAVGGIVSQTGAAVGEIAGSVGSGISEALGWNLDVGMGLATANTQRRMEEIATAIAVARAKDEAAREGQRIGSFLTGNISEGFAKAKIATAKGLTEIAMELARSQASNEAGAVGSGIGNNLTNNISRSIANAREVTARGLTLVRIALTQSGAEGTAGAVGSAITGGLAGAIGSGMDNAIRIMRSKMNELAAVGAGVFRVASPSKLMKELGGYIMQGLALGISDGSPEVLNSFRDSTNQLKGMSASFTSDIAADGVITHQSDGLRQAIEEGIGGWRVEIDRQGIARLAADGTRRNKEGR
jgi:hypothetical protein